MLTYLRSRGWVVLDFSGSIALCNSRTYGHPQLSLTTPELADAVKAFPRNVYVQALALQEARKAGKSGEDLAPYIARLITAEYAQLTGQLRPRDSYKLKRLFAELAREL